MENSQAVSAFAQKILVDQHLDPNDPGATEVATQLLKLRLSLVESSRARWPTMAQYKVLETLVERYAMTNGFDASVVAHHLLAITYAIIQNQLPPGPTQSVSEFIRYMAENFALEQEIAAEVQSKPTGGSQ